MAGAKGDSKSIWNILNEAIPKKKYNKVYTSLTEDQFVNHFSKTGKSISETFEPYNNSEETTIKGSAIHKFNINSISEEEVTKYLRSFPDKHSLDSLNMDAYLFRVAADNISKYLAHIFNLSVKEEYVPNDWKTN